MNKKLFVPKLKNYELLFTAFKVNKYALTNKNFLAVYFSGGVFGRSLVQTLVRTFIS